MAMPPRAADIRALRLRSGLRARDRRSPGGPTPSARPRARATHGPRHAPLQLRRDRPLTGPCRRTGSRDPAPATPNPRRPARQSGYHPARTAPASRSFVLGRLRRDRCPAALLRGLRALHLDPGPDRVSRCHRRPGSGREAAGPSRREPRPACPPRALRGTQRYVAVSRPEVEAASALWKGLPIALQAGGHASTAARP